MQQQHFTYEQWQETFRPHKNPVQQRGFDGTLFETYGDELAFVVGVHHYDARKVWTLEEADGQLIIVNGMRLVNRLGYLITERPAPANTYIEVDCED